MNRIDTSVAATGAVLMKPPGRWFPRVARGAYVVLVLIVILGALAVLAASPAHATTVKGTFQYKDKDAATQTETNRPIANAKVEIWRWRSRCFLCIGTWGKDATTTTDANGSISFDIPFAGNGVQYAVKVFATNDAAIVWPNDAIHTIPFHREPGQDDGKDNQSYRAFGERSARLQLHVPRLVLAALQHRRGRAAREGVRRLA